MAKLLSLSSFSLFSRVSPPVYLLRVMSSLVGFASSTVMTDWMTVMLVALYLASFLVSTLLTFSHYSSLVLDALAELDLLKLAQEALLGRFEVSAEGARRRNFYLQFVQRLGEVKSGAALCFGVLLSLNVLQQYAERDPLIMLLLFIDGILLENLMAILRPVLLSLPASNSNLYQHFLPLTINLCGLSLPLTAVYFLLNTGALIHCTWSLAILGICLVTAVEAVVEKINKNSAPMEASMQIDHIEDHLFMKEVGSRLSRRKIFSLLRDRMTFLITTNGVSLFGLTQNGWIVWGGSRE